jgi:hypothetical protein
MSRKKLLALAGATVLGAALAAGIYAPSAQALPGQCVNTPWGGFCDSYAWADGSFQHCQGALGFSSCFQACHDPVSNTAVPTDLDPRTPCP